MAERHQYSGTATVPIHWPSISKRGKVKLAFNDFQRLHPEILFGLPEFFEVAEAVWAWYCLGERDG